MLIGLGPGSLSLLTQQAKDAIQSADFILGYKTYIDLIAPLITKNQQVKASGMTKEWDRCSIAIQESLNGKNVALVCSGDSGVYAMAPLILEILATKYKHSQHPQIEIIPGITAATACASLAGAPLGHDHCSISLSDLLTPWSVIEKRIQLAAQADFVISFYNPRSKKRQQQIVDAQKILLQYRDAKTPVAIINAAYRDEESIILSRLDSFTELDFAMNATVIIGNSNSYQFKNWIITPRGYSEKYMLDSGLIKEGQQRGQTLR